MAVETPWMSGDAPFGLPVPPARSDRHAAAASMPLSRRTAPYTLTMALAPFTLRVWLTRNSFLANINTAVLKTIYFHRRLSVVAGTLFALSGGVWR
jgi:hypothetical protein